MVSLQVVTRPKVRPPEIPWPKGVDPQKDREGAMKWWEEWQETEEGKQFSKDMQRYQAVARAAQPVSYRTNIEPTGEFTFDDLPADNYQLTVRAQAQPKDGQIHAGHVIARLTHAFRVPEMRGGRSEQSLDVGELMLKTIQRPNVRQ